MAIRIHTEQKFTDVGLYGVALFVGSPIASAIGYAWLLYEFQQESFYRNVTLPWVLIGASGIGFLIGTVMMLIGRSQTHIVERFKMATPERR